MIVADQWYEKKEKCNEYITKINHYRKRYNAKITYTNYDEFAEQIHKDIENYNIDWALFYLSDEASFAKEDAQADEGTAIERINLVDDDIESNWTEQEVQDEIERHKAENPDTDDDDDFDPDW